MCKGPQSLACAALSQMGKTKTKLKTHQYEWNNTNTNRADKDVLVGFDEADCPSESPYLVSSLNRYNHLRYTY